MDRAVLVVALLASAATWSPTLWGQSEPSAADKETARTLYGSGMSKLAEGRAADALEDLKKADLIMGVPTTRTAVGKAQIALGQLLEARDTLLSVKRIPPRGAEPAPFVAARKEAATLADELADRIPSLQIAVTGLEAPAQARVSIDGQPLRPELLDAPRKLNPGEHRVEVSAPGYETKTASVVLAEGERKKLDVAMARPAPAKEAPVPEPADDAGGWTIHPVTWVGVALAGAGLVAGGITGGLAAKRTSDLNRLCPEKSCNREDHEGSLTTTLALAHASTASFAVAGAGAALALVGLFALSGSGDGEDVALRVAPLGLRLEGRF